MKNVLQLFMNIVLLVSYFIFSITFLFWYGKLPKVSPYHYFNINGFSGFTIKEMFNDPTIQGRYYYPKDIEDKIFRKKLTELYNNENVKKYLNSDVPILDSEGKKYGIKTLYSHLIENSK